MELSSDLLHAAEERFGRPLEASLSQELLSWEMDLIERVCGDTRFHDLTSFILHRGSLALVHKPSEPEGAYWAPAGGLAQGEQMEAGVRREVHEETGLVVEVERYLLRVNASFSCGERSRPWTSHVFLSRPAEPLTGHPALVPLDTKEVQSAAWVTVERFVRETLPLLAGTGWGRFRYRLGLAELAFRELGLEG